VSAYPTRVIETALARKRFQLEQTHHRILQLFVGGAKTRVRTRISHGAREYGDQLLGLMWRELHLTRKELEALIQCPMSAEAYVDILVARGAIRPP